MAHMSDKKTVYADKLRDICGYDFVITRVFPAYRSGFDPKTNKMKQFYRFPVDARMVVSSNDESIMSRKDEPKKEFREKVWNKTDKKMEFHKYSGKMDSEFFKTFKKTFDIEVKFKSPVKIKKWNVPEGVETDEVRVPVNSSHIKTMLETYTNEADSVNLVPGKDKAGNPAMVKPFDWEDALAVKLVGVFANAKVTGTGLDTQYIWKPATPFEVKKEDTNFEDFGKPEQKKAGESTIRIEDVPF